MGVARPSASCRGPGTPIRCVRYRWRPDTQDDESTNNTIKRVVTISPKIGQPTMSSRVTIQKSLADASAEYQEIHKCNVGKAKREAIRKVSSECVAAATHGHDIEALQTDLRWALPGPSHTDKLLDSNLNPYEKMPALHAKPPSISKTPEALFAAKYHAAWAVLNGPDRRRCWIIKETAAPDLPQRCWMVFSKKVYSVAIMVQCTLDDQYRLQIARPFEFVLSFTLLGQYRERVVSQDKAYQILSYQVKWQSFQGIAILQRHTRRHVLTMTKADFSRASKADLAKGAAAFVSEMAAADSASDPAGDALGKELEEIIEKEGRVNLIHPACIYPCAPSTPHPPRRFGPTFFAPSLD